MNRAGANTILGRSQLVLVLFLLLFSITAAAQQLAVRIYTAREGLPATYIFNTSQDRLGYLWVGTPEGLSRFDGKTFVNYGLADGLPELRALTGYMDSKNRYWACTARGVAEFKGNHFVSYPLSDSMRLHWVFRVLELRDGRVCCLTDAGVYAFDENKWVKLKLYPGYENRPCRGLVETSDGLYINYGSELIWLKKDGQYQVTGPQHPEAYYYNSLLVARDTAYISTLEGLRYIDHGVLKPVPGWTGQLRGLYIFYPDTKGRIWIARDSTIELSDHNAVGQRVMVYRHPGEMIPQNIEEDRLGNFWIGTSVGLMRFSEKEFTAYELSGENSNTVFSVIQRPGGPLLVNTRDGFFKFENGNFSSWPVGEANKIKRNAPRWIVDYFTFDDKNQPWLIMRGFQLMRLKEQVLLDQNNQFARLGSEAFDVLFDRFRKKILVAIKPQPLPCIYNDTGYAPMRVTGLQEVKGNINRLYQCANGTLLFATDVGGIYSIDTLNRCRLQLKEFSSESVISRFLGDPGGDVWIAYNGRGLRRYKWVQDQLVFKEEITRANGLSNDNITGACFDKLDRLWICTNASVAVFSKPENRNGDDSYSIVHFFDAEELQMKGAYAGRLYRDEEGYIWEYSERRMIRFTPALLRYQSAPPVTVIEKLELNLSPTNWLQYTDSLTGIFQLPVGLRLPHGDNNISFYFKGISSSGSEGIRYSYILDGLDNHWSALSENNYVSFIRLPPGSYTFKVRSQLPNSSWSAPAEFSFMIRKAFWETGWFYSAVALLLLLGIYGWFRYRLQQRIKVLEIRSRLSQDLHDEVGASLSGISLLNQIAIEKLAGQKTEEAADYLDKIKNYTRDIIEKLGDMVWIFNPENDSIEKLLQRLRSFAASLTVAKNIRLHFETTEEKEGPLLSIRQRKAIYLVSKEAINNAIKYSGCRNIYYQFSVTGNRYRVLVRDDGKGFSPVAGREGNGIGNMKARAAEIGGVLEIKSVPDEGTTLILEC